MTETITYAEAKKTGDLLYDFETSDYSWEAIEIYRVGDKYAYFTDGGCSCNGSFVNGNEKSMLLSKEEFAKVLDGWKAVERPSDYSYDAEGMAKYAFEHKEWEL